MPDTPSPSVEADRRRAWHGWCLYDWANSAFATVILAAVLPVYFASLVPAAGVPATFAGVTIRLQATALWGYAVAMSMLLVVLLAPYLGAWADARQARRQLLMLFCLTGSLATSLLVLTGAGDFVPVLLLFVIANFSFATGNIFYNSFLPALATAPEVDTLSSRGFAYGYIGGGLMLLAVFLLIRFHDAIGITDTAAASRLGFLATGLWWFLFALPTFRSLREEVFTGEVEQLPGGLRGYLRTFAHIRAYPDLLRFLLAFLFYNDGIQTIIAVAAIFARAELQLSQSTILGCFLMIQFVAMPGALLFGWLARTIGAKASIGVALTLFALITLYAGRMDSAVDFWVLGFVVAMVLGGSQAISRSLFASMLPVEKSAEFFGFYAISGRFASIFGPLLFAMITNLTGSARLSITALTLFFIVGMLLLRTVDVARGRAMATTDSTDN